MNSTGSDFNYNTSYNIVLFVWNHWNTMHFARFTMQQNQMKARGWRLDFMHDVMYFRFMISSTTEVPVSWSWRAVSALNFTDLGPADPFGPRGAGFPQIRYCVLLRQPTNTEINYEIWSWTLTRVQNSLIRYLPWPRLPLHCSRESQGHVRIYRTVLSLEAVGKCAYVTQLLNLIPLPPTYMSKNI